MNGCVDLYKLANHLIPNTIYLSVGPIDSLEIQLGSRSSRSDDKTNLLIRQYFDGFEIVHYQSFECRHTIRNLPFNRPH